jgi:hypothetical protein
MPGFTAYVGLRLIGKPQAGETVVVAAASGPVGSLVGQLAKLSSARAVGIAGGPDKCAYVKNELRLTPRLTIEPAIFQLSWLPRVPRESISTSKTSAGQSGQQ